MAGPLPTTTRGNRFILLAVDHFSRFVVGRAVPAATADEASRFWKEEVVAKYGAPERLLTDRGSNFGAAQFVDVVEALGTAKLQTTPYNPQGDARAERQIGSVKGRIKRALEETDAEWDEVLPWAVLALNSTPSAATGVAPFVVMHGHWARLQLAPTASGNRGPQPGETLAQAAVREALGAVRGAMRKVKEMQGKPRRQDKGARRVFRPGDAVLLWNPAHRPRGRWEGPWVVAETRPGGVLRLQDPSSGDTKLVNGRRARRYHWGPRTPPRPGDPAGAGSGEDVLE